MEAYQFLRHRQLIPPNVSLQETAMPNLTWGELIQLLDDYLKSKTAKAVGVDALVSLQNAENKLKQLIQRFQDDIIDIEDLEDDIILLLVNTNIYIKNEYALKYRNLLSAIDGWKQTLDKNSELYEKLARLDSILSS
jgi:hypothetical protein